MDSQMIIVLAAFGGLAFPIIGIAFKYGKLTSVVESHKEKLDNLRDSVKDLYDKYDKRNQLT